MAIDGVKIIDNDTAHDIYDNIIEAFKYDTCGMEDLREEFGSMEDEFIDDDLEHEIYITAYALAMWKIGGITEKQIQDVKELVAKGADDYWNKVEEDGKAKRQKELEKLLKQISKPNEKIIKQYVFKEVDETLFEPDEVFAFPFGDGTYGATFLIDYFYDRLELYYQFGEVILKTPHLPTLEEVLASKVFGKKGQGFEKGRTVGHKKLKTFRNKFQKIGTIKIRKAEKAMMKACPASSFKDFIVDWNNSKWGYEDSYEYPSDNFKKFLE